MKKNWVVYVTEGVGHEYHQMVQFSDFYGPFTKLQAEDLEHKLNKLFDDGNTEHQIACAMPLENDYSPKQIIKMYEGKV